MGDDHEERRHDGRRRRSQAPRRLLYVADGKHRLQRDGQRRCRAAGRRAQAHLRGLQETRHEVRRLPLALGRQRLELCHAGLRRPELPHADHRTADELRRRLRSMVRRRQRWFRILRRHQPDLEKHRQAHLLRLSQHHRLHPRAPTERPRLGTGVPLVRQRAGLLRKDLLVEHRHPLGAGRRQQQHRL